MTEPSPMEPAENTEDREEEEEETLGTQSTMETVGPCKRRIKAEVPSDKVLEELDKNYKELISSVQIPGFRRGRVPRLLIEKRYGGEIEGDVKETLLALSFQEVAKEKDLKVIGKPKFDQIAFVKGEPLRYEVEVEVRPEFELGAYKGIEVVEPGDEEVPPVRPEAIEAQVEKLRQKRGELVSTDPSAAGPGDVFIGHYILERDKLQVHLKEDVRFRPESNFLDGFEIPGLAEKVSSRGESSVFKVVAKVPDRYSEEVLRGKEVELIFTIEEAKRLQYPEANDEFAKGFEAASMADLREKIGKELEEQRRVQIEKILESRVVEKILGGIQFDLPEGLIEDQVKLKRLRLELSLIQEGRSREEIDADLKKVDEKAVDEFRREIKQFFILEKIAEEEKIFATEDDVGLHVAILARAYGRSAKQVQSELEESGRIETLRAEIRQAKTLDFLRTKAKVLKPGEAPSQEEEASGKSGESPSGTGEPAAAAEPPPLGAGAPGVPESP